MRRHVVLSRVLAVDDGRALAAELRPEPDGHQLEHLGHVEHSLGLDRQPQLVDAAAVLDHFGEYRGVARAV